VTITFPGESAEYRAARDRLLEREVELRRAMEAVAAARRELPPGGPVPEDYVFEGAGADGSPSDIRLSELFAPGKDSLVIYNFMFPRTYGGDRPGPTSGKTASLPLEEGPCPSCVALLDQLDGAASHATQHLNFAAVAKAPLERVLTFAGERGWRNLRLLSSANNTYNRDYLGETPDGSQTPMLNVFNRDGETIRHFWGAELTYGPEDPGRHHTMSLDGFIAGPDDSMDWAFGYGEATALADETMRRIGAILAGRRWHDLAIERWDGVDGIYGGAYDGQVFVLTHHPPEDSADPRISFTSDGIENAVATAQSAARDKDVGIFGGSLSRQCLEAGLLDEIIVHLAPVLLGGGVRLFDSGGAGRVELERVWLGKAEGLTDLRFRVVK
jgi:predicted dithiol-disulfide oxidoreductase (DUF899 family)/dihydrofolate reductase